MNCENRALQNYEDRILQRLVVGGREYSFTEDGVGVEGMNYQSFHFF